MQKRKNIDLGDRIVEIKQLKVKDVSKYWDILLQPKPEASPAPAPTVAAIPQNAQPTPPAKAESSAEKKFSIKMLGNYAKDFLSAATNLTWENFEDLTWEEVEILENTIHEFNAPLFRYYGRAKNFGSWLLEQPVIKDAVRDLSALLVAAAKADYANKAQAKQEQKAAA